MKLAALSIVFMFASVGSVILAASLSGAASLRLPPAKSADPLVRVRHRAEAFFRIERFLKNSGSDTANRTLRTISMLKWSFVVNLLLAIATAVIFGE